MAEKENHGCTVDVLLQLAGDSRMWRFYLVETWVCGCFWCDLLQIIQTFSASDIQSDPLARPKRSQGAPLGSPPHLAVSDYLSCIPALKKDQPFICVSKLYIYIIHNCQQTDVVSCDIGLESSKNPDNFMSIH